MRQWLTLLAAIGFAGACSGRVGDPAISTSELGSPAGPDSGEPFLSASAHAVFLSWMESAPAGGHDFRFARWDGAAWSPPVTIAHGDRFFVNWADFPSITPGAGGALWAHWLERGASGGYDYGVRIVRSEDGGKTWSEPWTPHEDDTPTEHGFVSAIPVGDEMGFLWLDGRKLAEAGEGDAQEREMTLRWRTVDADGAPGAETLVDARVCDCCQTDAAMTAGGPVVVYRDRSDREVRDIYVSRLRDGAWTPGRPVHEDGWRIAGCPVNGPSVVAAGDHVAVAWFNAVDDVPVVQLAFSDDGAEAFGAPIRIDDGAPSGRVDLLMLADHSVLVSWLERTGGENAEVRVRRVGPDGVAGGSVSVAGSSSERASGFPRLAQAPDGSVLMAWTDVAGDEPTVRVRRLELEH
jgi:hypothetical protein